MRSNRDSVNHRAEEVFRYGFEWGPMTVERSAHIQGRGYSLTIRTEHKTMQVYVSEKGNVIQPMPVRKTH